MIESDECTNDDTEIDPRVNFNPDRDNNSIYMDQRNPATTFGTQLQSRWLFVMLSILKITIHFPLQT